MNREVISPLWRMEGESPYVGRPIFFVLMLQPMLQSEVPESVRTVIGGMDYLNNLNRN